MKLSLLKVVALLITGMLLVACGGGVEDTTLPPAATRATVSGVASKGLIKNGVIKIYAATGSGGAGTLLATTATDSQGRYTVDIANYSGPLIIEAYGSYLDEATGQIVTIDAAAPLHAALPCVCATLSVAVTPLTELAYQKARAAIVGGADVATAITNATAEVSRLFSFDSTTTQPGDPGDLNSIGNDQRSYTLALAGIAQMMKESGGTVSSVIAGLNSAGTAAPAQVAAALERFLNSNPSNRTGFKSIALSLALTGVTTANVGSLDFTISLPTGTTIPADASGAVSPENFTVTGAATTALAVTKYHATSGTVPAQLRVIITAPNLLPDGPVALLRCYVPSATQPTAFVMTSMTAKDANGVTLPGVAMTVQ